MIIGTLRSRVDGTSGLSIVGQVSLGPYKFLQRSQCSGTGKLESPKELACASSTEAWQYEPL